MDRIKAFLFHFSISVFIFFVIAYFIVFVWYPDFHFFTDGGIEGIKLVAGVDLVLGPLLTLCVFKKGKPGLKRDLSLIATLQFSCLAIGLYLIYNERPVAVIYSDRQIYSVPDEMFDIFDRDSALLSDFPGRFPKLIYVDFGTDEDHLSYVRRKQHRDGLMQYRTDLYKPYEDFSDVVTDWAITTEELKTSYPHKEAFISDWIINEGYTPDTVRFINFSGRYMSGFMAINATTGVYVEVLARSHLRKPAKTTAK